MRWPVLYTFLTFLLTTVRQERRGAGALIIVPVKMRSTETIATALMIQPNGKRAGMTTNLSRAVLTVVTRNIRMPATFVAD